MAQMIWKWNSVDHGWWLSCVLQKSMCTSISEGISGFTERGRGEFRDRDWGKGSLAIIQDATLVGFPILSSSGRLSWGREPAYAQLPPQWRSFLPPNPPMECPSPGFINDSQANERTPLVSFRAALDLSDPRGLDSTRLKQTRIIHS